ncbi:MAG: zinc ribbon domain-containing protein [Pirellulaceae bacterium]|nr:zinc ribbon domain-containing protein [Pirellulaceae bacterium]
MNRKISDQRKTAFYVGTGISLVGLLMFLSIFVTAAMSFGDFTNFDSQVSSFGFRAVGGMILMMVGQAIRAVGARGLAGSGMMLDPEQARDDLHPYTNMAGGMLRDTLDAADLGSDSRSETRSNESGGPVIMIRCRACRELNDEQHRFCSQCGASLQE